MRYRIHEFELDVEGGQLIGPTGVVPLRRQVLLTLCHLLQRAPDLVPNDELLDAVWGRQAISPNVVPQAMRELRRAFGDDAREPRFIETRHRLGYRFIAPVQRINGAVPGASADAPAASMPEADSARALPASSRPEPRAARLTWRTVLLACTVIAVAGVAAVLLYPGRQVADASAPVLAEVLPRDAEARQAFHAALVARGHGDLAAAERNLRNAIRREPQSVASSADLARVLAEQGRFDDARLEAQRAAELNAPLSRSDALRLQALQAELDFDCSRAAELYRSVFAFEPGDVESAYRLFECELSLAERAGAESTLAAISKTLGDRAAQANPRLLLARAPRGGQRPAAGAARFRPTRAASLHGRFCLRTARRSRAAPARGRTTQAGCSRYGTGRSCARGTGGRSRWPCFHRSLGDLAQGRDRTRAGTSG